MLSAAKIRLYLDLLRERNIPAKKLLAGTGIRAQSLSDPNFLVDIEQHDAVVMNLMLLAGEPDIAFTAGERFDPSTLGIVSYALLSSSTLRNAMSIWQQYSNSLIGSPLRLVVNEQARKWNITVAPLSHQMELQRFYIEEVLVHGTKLIRLLASQPLIFHKLQFAYPRPRHSFRYQEWFNCDLEFDAPQSVFSIRSPNLDLPIRSSNEELNQVVSQYCQNILQQLPRSGMVEPRLRSLFLTNSSRLPGQEEASKQLGLSHRTLHRRLSGNGRTYRQLKDDFRLDLARQYLDSGHLTQKEISHALGYTSPSAFCRAFKCWTGETPGEYRDRTRGSRDNARIRA